jgi:hypothetical protein
MQALSHRNKRRGGSFDALTAPLNKGSVKRYIVSTVCGPGPALKCWPRAATVLARGLLLAQELHVWPSSETQSQLVTLNTQ